MYRLSGAWHSFYSEPDPMRRRRMLQELLLSETDDGANQYRLLLFNARHGDEKKNSSELDRFLFQFVNMVQVYRSARIFRKNARREAEKLMKELLWADAARYGEAGECALYWELRNAAMRYFKTCESSGYNRGLFGMVASGDDSRKDRICREIWQMTTGLTERCGLQSELSIWNRAVTDAYYAYDGGAYERLRDYQP